MAYINVDEVYILDNTGLQVDMATDIPFVDAGFTDAQKEQARKNIAAGGTNHNMLDNPWWGSGEVINQRSVTTGSTPDGIYTIDRWFTTYYGTGGASGTYSLGMNGMTITPSGSAYCGFAQKLAYTLVAGKTYTLSAMLSDGTIISASKAFTDSNFVWFEDSGLRAQYISSTNAIRIYPNVSLTIRAVKLELGSVSTLANDTPPDYGTELLKCQYYAAPLEFITYTNPFTGIATSTTEFFVEAYLPRSMREINNPTISVTGTAYAIRNGSTGAITAWEAGAIKGNHIRLKGTTTNLTANTQVPVYTAGNTLKIFVSADL